MEDRGTLHQVVSEPLLELVTWLIAIKLNRRWCRAAGAVPSSARTLPAASSSARALTPSTTQSVLPGPPVRPRRLHAQRPRAYRYARVAPAHPRRQRVVQDRAGTVGSSGPEPRDRAARQEAERREANGAEQPVDAYNPVTQTITSMRHTQLSWCRSPSLSRWTSMLTRRASTLSSTERETCALPVSGLELDLR